MASITVQLHELEQVIHVFDPLSLTGDIEVKKKPFIIVQTKQY